VVFAKEKSFSPSSYSCPSPPSFTFTAGMMEGRELPTSQIVTALLEYDPSLQFSPAFHMQAHDSFLLFFPIVSKAESPKSCTPQRRSVNIWRKTSGKSLQKRIMILFSD